jgi:protein gp37
LAENSKIEWTHHTFNPWIGCQKVSPGCDNCYAEAMMDHRYGRVTWGPHGERVRTSPANWRKPISWDKAAAKAGRRDRVFCASLADWLDNKVPRNWRTDLWGLIEATPNLDWLLLTKRPENYAKLAPWHNDKVPRNIWYGVTAEDQLHFDRRWKVAQQVQSRVHFISYEPALGPLSLFGHTIKPDWIICGGESGKGARTMETVWARSLRDECKASGTAFFFKQMTGKKPIPEDLLVREFPVPGKVMELAA